MSNFFLRWIYRRCGVTFHCSPNGEKPLKNAVLDEFFTIFVDENLKKKNDLMFYFDVAAESDSQLLLFHFQVLSLDIRLIFSSATAIALCSR